MSRFDGPDQGRGRADLAAAATRFKAAFDDVYTAEDPRPYFRVLGNLDYREPAHMHRIAQRLLGALPGPARRTVLDVCCSYGMLGVLLRSDLSFGDLAGRYRDGEVARWTSERLVEEDRLHLLRHRSEAPPEVIGLDSAGPAVSYAQAVGAIADGFVEDLEAREPSPRLTRALATVDLVTVSGGVGYVAERTLERVLRPAGASPPWVAALVSRVYPYDRIATVLAGFGMVTERYTARTFARRRFADTAERSAVLAQLEALGLDPASREADGWYHADLFVSRPVTEVHEPIDELLAGL